MKIKPKTLYLILVLIAIIGAIYELEQSKVKPQRSLVAHNFINDLTNNPANKPNITDKPERTSLKNGIYPQAPELAGISGYLNLGKDEKEIKIADFRGKVALIDFWTYTCINCIRTLPHLIEWDQKYRDKGLVIIGVHTPEFEFEKKQENVKAAMEKYGITYRVVQDNEYATWQAFGNRYWPHEYLIDAEGYIRHDHIGEGRYAETEQRIQELLAEIPFEGNKKDEEYPEGKMINSRDISLLPDDTPQHQTTPELYAGYGFALPRGQNLGNTEGLQPGKMITYVPVLNQHFLPNIFYLQGSWQSNEDNLEAKVSNASLYLDFTAAAVHMVAASPLPVEVEVMLDGHFISRESAGADVQFRGDRAFVRIQEPRLYTIVQENYHRNMLQLITPKGLEVNSFTFG